MADANKPSGGNQKGSKRGTPRPPSVAEEDSAPHSEGKLGPLKEPPSRASDRPPRHAKSSPPPQVGPLTPAPRASAFPPALANEDEEVTHVMNSQPPPPVDATDDDERNVRGESSSGDEENFPRSEADPPLLKSSRPPPPPGRGVGSKAPVPPSIRGREQLAPPARPSTRSGRGAPPAKGADLEISLPRPPLLPSLSLGGEQAETRAPLPPSPSQKADGRSSPPPPSRKADGRSNRPVAALGALTAAPVDAPERGGRSVDPRLGKTAAELEPWLAGQLRTEQHVGRQGRLHLELAQLLEFPGLDFERAKLHYQKAYDLLPTHEAVVAGLVRVALLLSDYPTALRYMDAEVKLTRAPSEKAQRLLALGLLLEDHMSRPTEARRAYEQALELSPLDPAILRALAGRLRAEGDHGALDLVLSRQAEVASADPFLRAARVARRARLVETQRGEPELAAELFELAFQAAPDATAALLHLERLHGRHGQQVALTQALTRKAQLITDPEIRATGLERRAYIELDQLGQLEAGLVSLEQAAESSPFDRDLLRRLAEQYARSGQPERALVALERLDKLLTDPRELGSARLKAARICENDLKDLPRALSWYERARTVQPGSPAIVLPLVRVYRQVGAFPELVEVLLGEERVRTDSERRAALLAEAAEIYETKLGSTQEARVYHARALAVSPGYGPSERALIRLYSDARMTPELIELLERAAENASNPEIRERHLLKVATLYEDWLGEHEKALQTYRRILSVNPVHGGALLGGQNAAERAQNGSALIELLEAEATITEDSGRRVSLLVRAADAARDRLQDPGRAQGLYEKALGTDSRSRAATSGLARLFEMTGRFEDLVEVRRKEVETTQDPSVRAQILYEIADLLENQLGSPERAVGYLKRATGADPDHQAARDRLLTLLGHTHQHEELLKQLGEEAARAADPEVRSGLWLRQARVLENVLDRPSEALTAYSQALHDNRALRPAKEGRLRLLSRTGQTRAFAAELEADAAALSEARLALWEGLAASEVVLDELCESGTSKHQLEALLVRFPSHPLALLLLEEALAKTGPAAELTRVLEDQFAHFTGPEQLGALSELLRRASAESAPGYVAAWLERQPQNTHALEFKERLALTNGDLRSLAEALLALAESHPKQTLGAQYWVRLGAIWETGDPAQALRAYRSALEGDAESFAAARGLTRIAEHLGEPELLVEAAQAETRVTRDRARGSGLMVRAAQVLDQRGRTAEAVTLLERALEIDANDRISGEALAYFLGRSGDSLRLAKTLSAAAQAATDPLSVSQHWMIVARVYEEQLQDRGAALAALGRIEKQVPRDVAALRALGDLYSRDRQFAQAAERLERAREILEDVEARLAVELDLCELYQEQLGRRDEAERIVTEVLRKRPGERRALRIYFQVLADRRDPRAQDVAKRWADQAAGTERTQALAALGRLLRDRGSLAESKEVLLEALPGAGAGGLLTDLLSLLSNKDEVELGQVVVGLEAHARSDAFLTVERAESAFQAGRILLDRLGQLARARQAFTLALELDPAHIQARSHLVTCLERGGDLNAAFHEAQVLVEVDSIRGESWLLLRRVLELLGRPAEAERTLGPLSLLGGASEADRLAYRSRAPRAGHVVPGSAREGLAAMLDPIADQGGDTLWLLNELSGLGSKMFPGGLELLGLSVRDRITPRMQHPLRAILDRVTRAFGVAELDLYPIESRTAPPRLVFGESLSIAVPTSLLELREAEQVYLLAELLAGVSLGVPLLFILSEEDVLRVIVAAGRTVEPSFVLPGVAPGLELDELTRRIARAPSWLTKGKFTDRVRRYLSQSGPDPRALVHAIHRSSRAIALILADDLSPLELLHQNPAAQDRVGQEGLGRVEGELLSSWMSVRAARARAQMGL